MLTRVIINVQNSLAATGAKGAGGLAAQFRGMDADGDGALTSAEFAEGLKKAGVKVRPVDVAALFQATDANKDGRLAFGEFVDSLCGPLSPHRRSVVEGVWRRIAGSEEEITLARLLSAYKPEKHPLVERGAKTPFGSSKACEVSLATRLRL